MKIEYTIESERPTTKLPALYQNTSAPDLVVLFISVCVGVIVEIPVGLSGFTIGETGSFSDGCLTGPWKRLAKGSSVTFTQED